MRALGRLLRLDDTRSEDRYARAFALLVVLLMGSGAILSDVIQPTPWPWCLICPWCPPPCEKDPGGPINP